MQNIELTFASLILASLLLLILFVYILLMENKSQIIYAFLSVLGTAFLWALGNSLELYSLIIFGEINKIFIYLGFAGLCFLPISLFFVGIIFARTKISFNWFYILLSLLPIMDFIFIMTNETHHLFIVKYAFSNFDIEYGKYFIFHTLISYLFMSIALYYLITSSIKNSGLFSKQSTLIVIGVFLPMSVNILYTLRIVQMQVYLTCISFSVAVIMFVFAILKFSFLDVIPIALRNVIDNISDSFIVINHDLKVVDHNKTLLDTFSKYFDIERNMELKQVFSKDDEIVDDFKEIIDKAIESRKAGKPIQFNKNIVFSDFNKHFTIEITPIFNNTKKCLGTIILLKDITQSVRDMETIKEKQEIMMGQERLASLGQLIGGIAHNLKTPIMSISGGIEGVRDLALEYQDSIGDNEVTLDDHKEIAAEILEWVDKIKPHCSYMSDIISAVKGQTIQFNSSPLLNFTIDELVKRIEILLKHELIRYHANMYTIVEIDRMTEVKGDVNSMVQVLDNIIINAIQAYEGEMGEITFKITDEKDNVTFMIRDQGKGMSEELKGKLFNEMVTTKGKDGTGLGLFMSYSTIKGRFEGDMWVESELGVGTTFYISIPKLESLARVN